MNKFICLLLSLLGAGLSMAQNFHPIPGLPGSIAIHKDSSIITAWATGIDLQRGLKYKEEPAQGYAAHGVAEDALGLAEGNSMNVVSLGDSGVAILTFNLPITNGPGYDFAVFENGFADDYIELAFVEVSSDGIYFVRFPATSEANTTQQIGNFETTDCRLFNNLAGKYRQGYGTPFDLDELKDSLGIDINRITHVKIIDVVGSIDPLVGSLDQYGTVINDPYPSNFDACGFDLDAVAVIHEGEADLSPIAFDLKIYPNPVQGKLNIKLENEISSFQIFNHAGSLVNSETNVFANEIEINTTNLSKGIYFITIETENGNTTAKFVVE
jgi:hypothetical protein